MPNKKNPKVDAFLGREKQWREAFTALRAIALDCGLDEDLKWGQPCYADEGRNVVLIHGFKEYCALLFMKGALMKDPKGILIRQTQHVQAARQIRFTKMADILRLKAALKGYVRDAMAVEKSGAKVKMKTVSDFKVPEEFQRKLKELPALKKAFEALTPGRQKGYLLHFGQAKQAATREARVEKYLKQILAGKGLDD